MTIPQIPSARNADGTAVANLCTFPGSVPDAKAAIDAMITKYSVGLDKPLPKQPSKALPDKQVVLVTGTTGNLGAHLLAGLLQHDAVAKVYALNRPARESNALSILDRHKNQFADKELDVGLLASEKLTFIEADAASPRLGLPEATYFEVRNNFIP
jgi:hypothetical protein